MERVSITVSRFALFCGGVSANAQALEIQFPVEPILFADDSFQVVKALLLTPKAA